MPNHTDSTDRRRAAAQHQNLQSGFVIHARRRGARNALGVITLSGESLALTPRLVEGLAGRTLRLFGTAPIQLTAGATIGSELELRAKADLALSSVKMHVDGVSDPAASGHVVEVEAAVMADALAQPLVQVPLRAVRDADLPLLAKPVRPLALKSVLDRLLAARASAVAAP